MKKMDMFFFHVPEHAAYGKLQIEHLINNLQAAEFKFQILKNQQDFVLWNHQTTINQVGTHLGDLGDLDGIQNAA